LSKYKFLKKNIILAVIGPEIFVRNLRIQTRKSEAIFSKSVSLYLREFGSNHIQTATLYDRIGEFYQSQGKLDVILISFL